MDLGFSSEQQMLKRSARDFLQREAPLTHVRAMGTDPVGYDRTLWKKMAALGWLGLPFPEAQGGSGGTLTDLLALYEEFGRALLPGPHLDTIALGGGLIHAFGTQEQQAQLLPAIASGDLTLALALAEPGQPFGVAGVHLSARRTSDGWVLDGAKSMVPYAPSVDRILCVAREEASGKLGLFLVEAGAVGLESTPLPNIAELPLFATRFNNVAGSMVGESTLSWDDIRRVLDRGLVLRCAEMVGAAHRALELATAYSKERVQFGQPIGKFQAVQWLCVDIALAAHTASLMTRQAAWSLEAGRPSDGEVAMAKAYASAALRDAVRQAHEVFAGVAFIIDHDLHLYTRRAKAWEVLLGDIRYHREQAAQAMRL